jgi:uncharacterized membrane-anchored protein
MKAGQYIRTLAEFVTGEIELLKFRQLVEDRIFELNQKPEMTEEKRVLSSVELHLHEVEEGLRDENEVYAHVQSILDTIILQRLTSKDVNIPAALPLAVPKTRYLLSKTFDVDIKHSDTEQKELPMLASI